MRVREMLSSHPQAAGVVDDALAQCMEACFDCAQVCMSCADACLAEDRSSELTRCIRLDLDCADACAAPSPRQPPPEERPDGPRLEGWEGARSLLPILRDAPFGRSSELVSVCGVLDAFGQAVR